MSASPQTATWRSGIPIAVTLPDMTVVGPTEMGIPEHEHPEVQISMTFVAQSPLGKTKAIRDFPTHFSLHPSGTDRKSTRLNSSHLGISYAVFCLKKKQ